MKKCEGIYSLIGKVNHKSVIYGFELLKEENIHPRQMPLIIHLKKCEGCTQKELAEKMQVKPSTLRRSETPRDVQFYKRGAGRTQETVK